MPSPPFSCADWMAALDDRRGLWELTIPGTHDSGARHGILRPRTQTLDIPGQLEAGIRFLDVRLRDDCGVLRVYHGGVNQRAELEADVVGPILGFLGRHPGEAVIMSVKREDVGESAAFARDFKLVVDRHAAGFCLASDFPRLADARGKIVVLRRFPCGAIGIPAPPGQWPNDTTARITTPGGALVIEDQWTIKGFGLGEKWAAVARNLEAAAATATGWYLTFTSATGDFIWPRAIAGGMPGLEGINRRLLDYLAARPGGRRLGTVVMDFPELPDGGLIRRLVDANRPASSTDKLPAG